MADDASSTATIASLRRSLRITQAIAVLALAAGGFSTYRALAPTESITLANDEFVTEIEPGRVHIHLAKDKGRQGIYLGSSAGSQQVFAISMDELFRVETAVLDDWSADLRLGRIGVGDESVHLRAQERVAAELAVGGVDQTNRVSINRGTLRMRTEQREKDPAASAALSPSALSLDSGRGRRARLSYDGTLSFGDEANKVDELVSAKDWLYLRAQREAAENRQR